MGQRKERIDLIIRGLGRGEGRCRDRLQVSAQTNDPQVAARRRALVRSIADRDGGLDLLRALYDGRFDVRQLEEAANEGRAALQALLTNARTRPLSELLYEYIQSRPAGMTSTPEVMRVLERFLAQLPRGASPSDFTARAVERFLAGLTKLTRRGDTGEPVSAATYNRRRAQLSGFGSWLAKHKLLPENPVTHVEEAEEEITQPIDVPLPDQERYLQAIGERLGPAYRTLAHCAIRTGADVGELIATFKNDGDGVLLVRHLYLEEEVPRVRFKRQKVKRSPERFPPIPLELAAELRGHVAAHGLQAQDPVFGMCSDWEWRAAHEEIATAIGWPELTRKKLRHLAAIAWRRAGADLHQVMTWLGHTSITQTLIYQNFGKDATMDGRVVASLQEKLDATRGVIPIRKAG